MPRRAIDPDLLTTTDHAAERMAVHDVDDRDVRAVCRDNPVLVSQKPRPEWREGSGYRVRPRRLKIIGRDARQRLLTLIIEELDERGGSLVITMFPTDNANDIDRYWRSR